MAIGGQSGEHAKREQALAQHFDAAAVLEPPKLAPALALRNYLGQPVNIDSYRGKAVLVTFLYTNCPDICPLITSDLRVALNLMGPAEASKVQIIAVSVDPRGDTPKAVAAFLARHEMTGRMQYLIGSAKELARVWKAWGVGSERDAATAAVRQPHGARLRDHRLRQAPDLLRVELPALGNRPRRAAAGRSLSAPPMTRRLRPMAWTLVLVAASAALALFGLASHPASGRAAPALPREHLAGAPVTLASLLTGADGRPALVVFWASWCGPCAQEAPALERFSESPAGRGQDRRRRLERRAVWGACVHPALRWTFPNLRDAEGTVGNAYRLTGLPTTFVIDANGRIRRVLRGPQNEHSLQAALAAMERS